jgi:Cell Wall Hydrolase
MSDHVTIPYEPRPRDFAARFPRGRVRTLAARMKRRHTGRRAAVLLAAIAVPAFAAPGDWSEFAIGAAGEAKLEVLPMPFEKGGDSFPGSAFYYLAPDNQSYIAPLETGSYAEGAPVPGSITDSVNGPIARAMRIDLSGVDRTRAVQCLTAAIYYEAASEADAGQRAVAQVVLNRVAHPSYPNTVCGVVYQGSERVTGCQFSFTCDGSLRRVPNRFFWQRAEQVAAAALSGFVYTPVGLATHYHTIQIYPYWAPSLAHITTIGAHRFYKFKGRAGSMETFRFAYAGGEPIAAPHARSATATASSAVDAALDPLALQRAYDSGVQAAQGTATGAMVPTSSGLAPVRAAPAPTYSQEQLKRGGDAPYRGEKLPEATGIKPEYEKSGTWINQPGS